MQRAKREHDNYASNQWSGQQQQSGARQKIQRPGFSHGRPVKRQRTNFPNHSAVIASSREIAPLSPQLSAASPSLADLRAEICSKDRSAFLWDKAPSGFDYLNVRVLKLFNLAHPAAGIQNQEIPAHLRAIKNVKALNLENSRIFRTLQEQPDREPTVYQDILSASKKVAEFKGDSNRPHPMPRLHDEKDSILYGDKMQRSLATLMDPDALVVCDCSGIDEIVQRYNADVSHYYELDDRSYAVVFADPKSPLSPDFHLYTPNVEKPVPSIEVLNAFPMVPTGRSTVAHITKLIGKSCEEFDSGPVKSISVNNGRKVAGRPRWVTISLEDPARVRSVAEKLGTVKLQGRPLITNIGDA